jgi:hypothetical protein
VRPGWFDYNKSHEHQLVFLQGHRRLTGNSICSRELLAHEDMSQLPGVAVAARHQLNWARERIAL